MGIQLAFFILLILFRYTLSVSGNSIYLLSRDNSCDPRGSALCGVPIVLEAGVTLSFDMTLKEYVELRLSVENNSLDIRIGIFINRSPSALLFQMLSNGYSSYSKFLNASSVVYLPSIDPMRYSGDYVFRLVKNAATTNSIQVLAQLGAGYTALAETTGSSETSWSGMDAVWIFVGIFAAMAFLGIATVLLSINSTRRRTQIPNAAKPKMFTAEVIKIPREFCKKALTTERPKSSRKIIEKHINPLSIQKGRDSGIVVSFFVVFPGGNSGIASFISK